jgi:spore maturation protein CgeB
MMGACYLTEWTAGLDSLYESGKDIETYRDAEELAENLQTLRRDPIRRQALRESAQRRALKEHSVPSSLRAITRSLGLSP